MKLHEACSVLLVFLLLACGGSQRAPVQPTSSPAQAPDLSLETLGELCWQGFDEQAAMELVAFQDGFFRAAGDDGYVAVLARLEQTAKRASFDTNRVPLGQRPTWNLRRASLALKQGNTEELLHDIPDIAARDRVSVLVGSGAVDGIFRVVRAGSPDARPGDVILVEGAPPSPAAHRGVLSLNLEPIHRAAEHPDVIQFGYLPSGYEFGFSLSPRSHGRLLAATENGPAEVHVRIEATRSTQASTGLSLGIGGSDMALPPLVLVAHTDEPGANDNGSGTASLLELALTIKRLIAAEQIPPPTMPLVFLFGEEITVSRVWLSRNEASGALVLDMVGEDPAALGSPFLIERMPDPANLWLRPPDAHTEWGESPVPRSMIQGHFLNAFVAKSVEHIASSHGPWEHRENPYEGGSDHVPFLERGLPAVLAWHFTDDAYHTSRDRLDRVSGMEMRRVSATLCGAALALTITARSGLRERMAITEAYATTRIQTRSEAVTSADPSSRREEARALEAWRIWHDQALLTASSWPVNPAPSPDIMQAARARVAAIGR